MPPFEADKFRYTRKSLTRPQNSNQETNKAPKLKSRHTCLSQLKAKGVYIRSVGDACGRPASMCQRRGASLPCPPSATCGRPRDPTATPTLLAYADLFPNYSTRGRLGMDRICVTLWRFLDFDLVYFATLLCLYSLWHYNNGNFHSSKYAFNNKSHFLNHNSFMMSNFCKYVVVWQF